MTTLNWREIYELRLTDKLIPNPNNQSDLLQRLNGVRVAVEGPMIHVDPRSTSNGEKRDDREEYDVFVVPASVVEHIKYRVAPDSDEELFLP